MVTTNNTNDGDDNAYFWRSWYLHYVKSKNKNNKNNFRKEYSINNLKEGDVEPENILLVCCLITGRVRDIRCPSRLLDAIRSLDGRCI